MTATVLKQTYDCKHLLSVLNDSPSQRFPSRCGIEKVKRTNFLAKTGYNTILSFEFLTIQCHFGT